MCANFLFCPLPPSIFPAEWAKHGGGECPNRPHLQGQAAGVGINRMNEEEGINIFDWLIRVDILYSYYSNEPETIMIKTYRLYHDGLVVQTWSYSYHDAALRQLARETLPGVWELQLVSLNPKTLTESQCNVARRVIEVDLVKTKTEYTLYHNSLLSARFENIYDARKGWREAITQPGGWSIWRENGDEFSLLSTADIVSREDWL